MRMFAASCAISSVVDPPRMFEDEEPVLKDVSSVSDSTASPMSETISVRMSPTTSVVAFEEVRLSMETLESYCEKRRLGEETH